MRYCVARLVLATSSASASFPGLNEAAGTGGGPEVIITADMSAPDVGSWLPGHAVPYNRLTYHGPANRGGAVCFDLDYLMAQISRFFRNISPQGNFVHVARRVPALKLRPSAS